MTKVTGLLVVGHGSKSSDAVIEFNATVEHLAKQTNDYVVRGAHMELAQPSIPQMVEELILQGIHHITVVPYFLFTGNHIKSDIPEILDEMKERFPAVSFSFGKPLGFEPILSTILLKRAQEATAI